MTRYEPTTAAYHSSSRGRSGAASINSRVPFSMDNNSTSSRGYYGPSINSGGPYRGPYRGRSMMSSGPYDPFRETSVPRDSRDRSTSRGRFTSRDRSISRDRSASRGRSTSLAGSVFDDRSASRGRSTSLAGSIFDDRSASRGHSTSLHGRSTSLLGHSTSRGRFTSRDSSIYPGRPNPRGRSTFRGRSISSDRFASRGRSASRDRSTMSFYPRASTIPRLSRASSRASTIARISCPPTSSRGLGGAAGLAEFSKPTEWDEASNILDDLEKWAPLVQRLSQPQSAKLMTYLTEMAKALASTRITGSNDHQFSIVDRLSKLVDGPIRGHDLLDEVIEKRMDALLSEESKMSKNIADIKEALRF